MQRINPSPSSQLQPALSLVTLFETMDILLRVLEYISLTDKRNLLNSTKLFIRYKKSLLYWKLTKKASNLYFHYGNLNINGYIDCPQKKLSLDLSFSKEYPIVTTLNGLDHCHTLSLQGQTKPLYDLRPLREIHDLNLSHCTGISDVGGLRFGSIHTLTLSHCTCLEDVDALGHIKILDLSYCSKITNVQALSGVEVLDLSYCVLIKNVSSLGGCKRLDLTGLNMVTDVSALGRINHLILDSTGVEDVSALGGVNKLSVSFTSVQHVSALANVHDLTLSGCSQLSDVSSLGTVHRLDLSMCNSLEDVSALGTVHELNLSRCPRITDVSALGRVHILDIRFCPSITSIDGLEDVHFLEHTFNKYAPAVGLNLNLGGDQPNNIDFVEDNMGPDAEEEEEIINE